MPPRTRPNRAPRRPRSPARRRGTFLVLVVAILAFLSLLTVAYVTLGRADERSSATLRQSDRVQSVERSVADYIARIIADDAVSVADMGFGITVDPVTGEISYNLPHLAAWDYPSIDLRYRSNRAMANPIVNPTEFPFNPVGTFGDDPWLADAEPMFLYVPNEPAARNALFYPENDRVPFLLSQGPLTGIRPSVTPGGGQGLGLLPTTRAEMRVDWRKISNVAPDGRFICLSNLRNNFEAEPGINAGQLSSTLRHSGRPNRTLTADQLNTPSFLTENQFNAYRPLNIADGVGPADPRYFPNQWADADGDGFADSRWFELVDASRGTGINDPAIVGLLPSGVRFRWFAAVRVVDLSAMVNVNTATSLRGSQLSGDPDDREPSRTFPAGLTPADVDLRRLLTFSDFVDQFAPFIAGYRFLYETYQQPIAQASITAQNSMTSDFLFELGDRAYESLRLRLLDPSRAQDAINTTQLFPEPDLPRRVYDYNAAERAIAFDLLADRDAFVSGSGVQRAASPLGVESTLELHTFRTANDPDVFSPLEAALSVALRRDGQEFTQRFSPVGGGSQYPPLAYYHILRAQRPLTLERLGRNNDASPQWTDLDAMAQSFSDLRQRLTTISGARPLRSRPNSGGSITPADLREDAIEIVRALERAAATDAEREAAVQRLFRLYADALLPYSDRTLGNVRFANGGQVNFDQVWNWNGGNNAPFNTLRTLFYGYRGPEFALLSAAHLAVNMTDLIDSEDGGSTRDPITSRTVLIDGSTVVNSVKNELIEDALNAANINTRRHRWAYPTGLDGSTYGVLDLDGRDATQPVRLADAQRTVGPDALQGGGVHNVYGIEPTPIIAELASFHIYTDSRFGDGADDEYIVQSAGFDPTAPPTYTWRRGGPTIDGRVSTSNPDFIAQVVVVQLHNPFDAPVSFRTQTDDGVEVPRFYIQFGERPDAGSPPRFFPVAGLSTDVWNNNAQFTSVPWSNIPDALRPGETRNVVLVTESLQTIQQRISDNTNAPITTENPFDRWLNSQFGIEQTLEGVFETSRPIVVAEFDPESPGLGADVSSLRTADAIDLLRATNDRARIGQALLWRAVYTPGETVTNALVDNDQLIDRLRDPQLDYANQNFTATLDSSLPTDFVVNSPNSQASPNFGESGHNSSGDNTGFSVTTWASIRRPTSNPGATVRAFPAWMYEIKTTGSNNSTSNSLNERSRLTPTDIDSRDAFRGTPYVTGTAPTLDELFRRQGGIDPEVLIDTEYPVPTIRRPPAQNHVNAPNSIGSNMDGLPFDQLYVENFPTERSGTVAPARLFSSDVGSGTQQRTFASIRAADFLRPLAIGPRFSPANINPDLPANSTDFSPKNASMQDLENAWLTLPEALALAAGYYDSPGSEGSQGDRDISFAVGGISPNRGSLATDFILPLDRGHLRIDAFTPFVNFNNPNLVEFVPHTNPTPGTNDDLIVGLGAPLAANIASSVRTVGRSTAGEPRARGSITEPIPGTININTAHLDVLRTLPMLSPLPNTLDPTRVQSPSNASPANPPIYPLPIPSYWWDDSNNPTNPNLAAHDARSDIAATLKGYRDLTGISTRITGVIGTVENNLTVAVPDFLDFSFDPNNPQDTGRRRRGAGPLPIVGTDAVRNQRGLLSTAEIFNARATTVETSLTGTNYIEPHSIDRLGLHPFLDGTGITPQNIRDIDQPGIDTIRYGTSANSDGIEGEHDQRLAIANAVLASTSVNSDYFMVWFVLHGYQRADVEGLDPNAPMLPSVRRRYVMIVDRSNVTAPGQMPRILEFRRVPE